MRSITLLAIMILFIASPVFAMDDKIVAYCLAEPDPRECLTYVLSQEEIKARGREARAQREEMRDQARVIAEERAAQRAAQERQYQQQMELLQEQSRGMALFGAGNAMINGMNQGLQNMQLPPPSVQFAPAYNIPQTTHPQR